MKIIQMEITAELEALRTTIKDWMPSDPGLLALLGSLLALTAGIFIWAAFVRKPPRHPHHAFRRPESRQKHDPADAPKSRGLFSFRKHHHRRHRHHYRRNPTLAEAGGLPPVRTEEQPPAST